MAQFGILDLVLIGVAVYFIWRMLSNRRGGDEQGPPTYDATPPSPEDDPEAQDRQARARAMWQHLAGEMDQEGGRPEDTSVPVPKGFDRADFLRGAKAMYARIRASWAKRDLADLRQFCAPEMMDEFERLVNDAPQPEETAVLLVEAAIQDVRQGEKSTEVDVRYEATLSAGPGGDTRTVQEIWRFTRDETVTDGHWLLASRSLPQ